MMNKEESGRGRLLMSTLGRSSQAHVHSAIGVWTCTTHTCKRNQGRWLMMMNIQSLPLTSTCMYTHVQGMYTQAQVHSKQHKMKAVTQRPSGYFHIQAL